MQEKRHHKRLEKEYRVEYGPFSALINQDQLTQTTLRNLGSGGVLFCADEDLPVGTQLLVRIHIAGWRQKAGEAEKTVDQKDELLLKAIAEVLHVTFDESSSRFLVGAQFLGQVQS